MIIFFFEILGELELFENIWTILFFDRSNSEGKNISSAYQNIYNFQIKCIKLLFVYIYFLNLL